MKKYEVALVNKDGTIERGGTCKEVIMTIKELEALDKTTITPKEAAGVLGCMPYYINVKARDGTLEFPAFFSGNRLKILREPFIKWVRSGRT